MPRAIRHAAGVVSSEPAGPHSVSRRDPTRKVEFPSRRVKSRRVVFRPVAQLGRRTWPGPRPARPRGGGRRLAPSPHDRAARFGQDDVGRAAPRSPASAQPRRGRDGDAGPLGRRLRPPRGRVGCPARPPGTTPPVVHRVAHRRRQLVAPARRGEPRHSQGFLTSPDEIRQTSKGGFWSVGPKSQSYDWRMAPWPERT